MDQFRIATHSYIDNFINKRPEETKLGEMVQAVHSEDWEAELQRSSSKFVLLGIPEDIGVRANYGVGGAHTLWEPALKAILNIQHTSSLPGDSLMVLGAFSFRELMQQAEHADVSALRALVTQIDDTVYPVIEKIIRLGKVPIVIGGGHNNAYPVLHGASLAKKAKVNCINLDAHSDYRMMEGRHSGNGFRYARKKGYLDKYAMVGLHENYNARNIMDELSADAGLHYSLYEDIFIRETKTYAQAIQDAVGHTAGSPTGIELDLDSVEHVLSSAATPSGITALQARQYINTCGATTDAAYLHITEGATRLRSGKEDLYTAKLVAYLVSDFIKARLNKY